MTLRLSSVRTGAFFLTLLLVPFACLPVQSGPPWPTQSESKGVPARAVTGGSVQTVVAAGDIVDCSSLSGPEATAKLLDSIPGTVLAVGDLAYPRGSDENFHCYDKTWGRHKSRTRPAPGNHEYRTAGAAGYFRYFGSAAGDPHRGYYSYNLSGFSPCARVPSRAF